MKRTGDEPSTSSSATLEDYTTAAAAAAAAAYFSPTISNSDGVAKRQRRQSWDFKTMAHFEEHHLRGIDGAQTVVAAADNAEDHNEQTEKPLSEQLQYYVHRVERFALHRHVTEFVLNGQHDEPEEALLNAFEHIIGQAIRNAEENTDQDGGGTAGHRRRVLKLGLTNPIVLPVRPPEQNTAEVLMAELDKLGQSDGDEDVHGGGISKRSLLLSEPIEIIVTCIAPPVGAAPRFHPYQHWGYDERHMIRIFNTGNNFCLFYALIATRAYTDAEFLKSTVHLQTAEGGQSSNSNHVSSEVIQRVKRRADFCSDHKALNRFVSNRDRLRIAVQELMRAADIAPDQDAYGMEHLILIQQLWDRIYTGMYRIVLFTDQPEELPRPIWKGPMGRRFCVSLFLSDGHYHGIKKIHCFFKLGIKYCVDCECFYGRDAKHTMSCKSRCHQCGKVGPQYPCIRVQGVCLHCQQCKRFFFSQSCFDGHRPQMCNLIKRCDECNRTFQVDRKNPHKCYSNYCARCKAHNASRFDGHFVLKYLGETKRRPEVIMNGLKIFEFRLQHSRRHSKLTWRDSCLLMPIRLEEMPKTFNLNCADKPFFPYAFNRRENYNVHLQHLPDKEDYCPGSMKQHKYEKFIKWYDKNKNTPFYLPDELKTYCRNDTEILLAAVVQFRQILMRDITEGFDVLPLSATIARSLCQSGNSLTKKSLPSCLKAVTSGTIGLASSPSNIWTGAPSECYWHGCESCFKPDDELVDGKTCRELNDATKLRLLKLQEPVPAEDACGEADEEGLDVEEIWECQIREQLKRDDEMRDFFDDLGTDRGPIDPRQTFYGGRTGPLQLIAEPKEDEKISVFDIVSLYPIPVLPLKIDERLLFCCCHRCAAKFRKLNTRRVHKCTHTDEQRAFTGNFTHIELARALETGYRVDRFWRAWHYDEWSDGIFKDYVRLLIKLKVEASGFPDGANTVEQQQQFADEYRRIYNVNLDLENVRRNPGLRFISKLMLNSLWLEVSAVIPLSDTAVRVMYKSKKNFVSEHTSSNIVISLWTTSRARLKLLDFMTQIDRTEGAKLLYTDTDSVAVLHKRDIVPIQTGEYLGQMSEEYLDYEIKTFSAEIRGITFDVNNSKALQFEHFMHKVKNYGRNTGDDNDDAPAVFSYDKIMPTRDSRVITRELRKKYMPICQKGIINEQYEVYPFGYE
ncbi:hypothetical protein niasHT_039359 [Heterodera trifolii]|uniref:DNA-directed DNA polymerase n=1 Tax=Heterodera trifolii TaxID=157864 RepID=A0ABD2IMU7_9BILA